MDTIEYENKQTLLYEQYKLKQCPMCGSSDLDQQSQFTKNREGYEQNWSFDVFCRKCEWSGEISPDELDDAIYELQYEERKKHYKEIYPEAKKKLRLRNFSLFGVLVSAVLFISSALLYTITGISLLSILARSMAILVFLTFLIRITAIPGFLSKMEFKAIEFIENKEDAVIDFDLS